MSNKSTTACSGTLNMTRLRSVASGGSGVLRGNLPDTEIEANVLNWKRAIAPKLDQEAKLPDFNIRSLISEMDTMLSTSCGKASRTRLLSYCFQSKMTILLAAKSFLLTSRPGRKVANLQQCCKWLTR